MGKNKCQGQTRSDEAKASSKETGTCRSGTIGVAQTHEYSTLSTNRPCACLKFARCCLHCLELIHNRLNHLHNYGPHHVNTRGPHRLDASGAYYSFGNTQSLDTCYSPSWLQPPSHCVCRLQNCIPIWHATYAAMQQTYLAMYIGSSAGLITSKMKTCISVLKGSPWRWWTKWASKDVGATSSTRTSGSDQESISGCMERFQTCSARSA